MVGTKKSVIFQQKILVSSVHPRGAKFQKIWFFREKFMFFWSNLLYTIIWLPCNIPLERTL